MEDAALEDESSGDVRRYFQDQARASPKRERTRAMILDAVVDAVFQRGLGATTIKEITEGAGVSHGTFYNHFSSRDEAILETASKVAMATERMVFARIDAPSDPREMFVSVTLLFMKIASIRQPWGRLLVETMARFDGVSQEASINFRETLRQIDPDLVTPVLMRQVGALVMLGIRLTLDGRAPPSVFVETCVAILRLFCIPNDEATALVERIDAQLGRV